MEALETIEEYYKRKFGWLPDNIKRGIGHFNVFPFTAYKSEQTKPVFFRKQDFYIISVASGHAHIHFEDKVLEMKQRGLLISSPKMQYVPKVLGDSVEGYYCFFNHNFLQMTGSNLTHSPIFQAFSSPFIELSEEQLAEVNSIYTKMIREINSEYQYKYDVLRCFTLELIHFAIKLQPTVNQPINASQRITTLFLELLERQFPINQNHTHISMRSASDFAELLNIHVNYLNKSVKEITDKTTSHIIAERVLQEAKLLLKYSNWNVSEIAYSLGFTEVTHFHNFFKKHTSQTALNFRNI